MLAFITYKLNHVNTVPNTPEVFLCKSQYKSVMVVI
jgi:hypothetical protein